MGKNKTPTIEALEAAFSAHYDSLTKEDRTEQIVWFLDAIDRSKLLEQEIYKTLEAMGEHIDTAREQFCMEPE